MSKARSLVDEKIAGKKVVMFSKSYCPYCKTAKSILSGYDLTPEEYEVIELDLPPYDANMDAMQNYLKEKTGARSVPRVFVSGKSLGGCDDTTNAHKNGSLRKMIKG